jgi:hypothetical protein
LDIWEKGFKHRLNMRVSQSVRMEDSGEESEDGDSSDNRVPASRQRGEEQCATNTQWSDFSLKPNGTWISCRHTTGSVATPSGAILVMH